MKDNKSGKKKGINRRGAFREATKGIARWGFGAAFMFHTNTLALYGANNQIHSQDPSKQRIAFKNRFGIPLEGWSSDIEDNLPNIIAISNILERELQLGNLKSEKGSDLHSVRIVDPNYCKKNWFDQVEYLRSHECVDAHFTRPINIPFLGRVFGDISLKMSQKSKGATKASKNDDIFKLINGSKYLFEALNHEIHHPYIDKVSRENPEFGKQWDKLFNLLRKDESKNLNQYKLAEIGFISNYAATVNRDEDMAELFAKVKGDHQILMNIDLSDKRYKTLRKKIELAIEYELVPKEFTNFIRLHRQASRYTQRPPQNQDLENFLSESEYFMSANPESIYLTDLYNDRIGLLRELSRNDNSRNVHNRLFDEHCTALSAPYKNTGYYYILHSLGQITREPNTKEQIVDAQETYRQRFLSGDVLLPSDGVNDKLKSLAI